MTVVLTGMVSKQTTDLASLKQLFGTQQQTLVTHALAHIVMNRKACTLESGQWLQSVKHYTEWYLAAWQAVKLAVLPASLVESVPVT